MKLKLFLTAVGLAALAFLMVSLQSETATNQSVKSNRGSALADVLVPTTLTQNATVGQLAYEAKCASCHGENAEGQDGVAPPLIHKIYEPGHHGDEAFQRAAAVGVKAHHWSFGDMPPVEGVTRADVKMIIAYIREVQQANGIH